MRCSWAYLGWGELGAATGPSGLESPETNFRGWKWRTGLNINYKQ